MIYFKNIDSANKLFKSYKKDEELKEFFYGKVEFNILLPIG